MNTIRFCPAAWVLLAICFLSNACWATHPTTADNDAAIVSLSIDPAQENAFTFGQVTDCVMALKNVSDKAIVVYQIKPVTNVTEDPVILSESVYGEFSNDLASGASYQLNSMAQRSSSLLVHVAFLLPGQEVKVTFKSRPLFQSEEYILTGFIADNKYDETAGSLAPMQVYVAGKMSNQGCRSYDPFKADTWRDICKSHPEVRPPGPEAPIRGVLIPQTNKSPKPFTVNQTVQIKFKEQPFTGEKAMEKARSLLTAEKGPLKLDYSQAFGGYLVMTGRDAYILTGPEQKELGQAIAAPPPQMLKDLDIRGEVLVKVGTKQGNPDQLAPWKLWDKYTVNYGDGMYTHGEFIRLNSGNVQKFLKQLKNTSSQLKPRKYYFHSRYYELELPQGSKDWK